MANGDAAAAAGMDTVAGTDDRRNGYDEDNKTRDYLANHETSGGHNLASGQTGSLPIANGGTGGTDTASALLALHAVENMSAPTNKIKMKWGTTLQVFVDSTLLGSINFSAPDLSNYQQKNTDYQVGGGVVVSTGGRDSTVTSGYHAAYWNGDGTLRSTPSALRFKKDIVEFELTDEQAEALLGLRDVFYNLKDDETAIDGQPKEMGNIAEELLEAGFPQIVPIVVDATSPDYGLPFTIDYARMSTLMHALAKWEHKKHAADLAELTARVEKLEGK